MTRENGRIQLLWWALWISGLTAIAGAFVAFKLQVTLANSHMLVLRPPLHQGGHPRMASLAVRFKRERQQHVFDCLAHQQHNTYLCPKTVNMWCR